MGTIFHSPEEKESQQKPDPQNAYSMVEEPSLLSQNFILFFFSNCSKTAALQGHIRVRMVIKLRKV